jgi:imidazolonepropionase-like amidohydrolase
MRESRRRHDPWRGRIRSPDDDPLRRPPPLSSFAAFALLALGWAAGAEAQAPARGIYAFTNVNVIPLDSERVLAAHSVLIEDGRITAVGPTAAMSLPAEATHIDGSGKYLLPGLAEMHGHVPVERDFAEDVLFLYVAAGATTVRGMQGHANQLGFREAVEAGEIVGPRLWLAAPSLNGESAPDAATAVRLVHEAHAAGFDLLKVHGGLTREVYDAIVRAANEMGLTWGGHVSEHVGVERALEAGQSTIDHLDGYLAAMQPQGSPALAASGAERNRLMALNADASRIPVLARATRAAGVAVVPTQKLWETLRGARDPATLAAQPENRYMPASLRANWEGRAEQAFRNASPEAAAREAALRQQLLAAMHDAGVLILLGTDAPQVHSVPGFSLYREMPLMVEAGLTPYEVLRTGTVNVAQHLGIEDQAGTIAAGKNADLLLLDANPLEDIGAVERLAGVMVYGRWLPFETIRERLEAIARKHQ